MTSETPSSHSPTIYKRVNIRWIPGEFEEPASTLVVSSPSGSFVDLRIDLVKPYDIDGKTGYPILQTGESSSVLDAQIKYNSIGYSGSAIENPSTLSTLAWAVGGYANYSSNDDGTTTGTWSQWVSYIPSPFKTNEEALLLQDDTGINKKMPDGSTFEIGSMVNPLTGKITDYEETWVDVPIANNLPFSPATKENTGCYLVAKLESADGESKGMIVWAGQACQGLLVYSNPNTEEVKIAAERWEYDTTASSVENQWVRVFKHGDEALPCKWLLHEVNKKWSIGNLFKDQHSDGSLGNWMVVETNFDAV